MKVDRKQLCLYAVTDRRWLGNSTLAQQVELALEGGVTFLQLREKDAGPAAAAYLPPLWSAADYQ